MSTAVDVKSLNKHFERHVREPGLTGLFKGMLSPQVKRIDAVQDLSFSMAEGESLALIGPNGAGKSTTLKILTGILHPSSGEVQVLGLTPWKDRTRLALNIATVFGQRSQLWYHLPARETFDLLASIYELKAADYHARRDELVRRFELAPFLSTPVRKLSLGERMRCEIAASLLHRPRVLFLDEPTIGLDVIAKQQIRELIRELNRDEGVSVLLTSHDAGDIEQLCERAVVINHGQVVFDDRVSTLKRRHLRRKRVSVKLREAYHEEKLPLFAGVQVLHAHGFELLLQVETDLTGIDALLVPLLQSFSVADISIEDPPMEDIIAALYQEKRRGGP